MYSAGKILILILVLVRTIERCTVVCVDVVVCCCASGDGLVLGIHIGPWVNHSGHPKSRSGTRYLGSMTLDSAETSGRFDIITILAI